MIQAVLLAAALTGAPGEPPKGHLVVAGGGKFTSEVRHKILEIAGGPKAHVLVVPQASRDPNAGETLRERWRDAGATEIVVLDPKDPEVARKDVASADLIWFRGGSQTRLMEALAGTGIPEAIRSRYQQGATIGGTSAGAAVMSDLMIAGRGVDFTHPRLDKGLGLWPDVIVDQHFVKRKRFDRLKGVVMTHPDLVGVGIDESTAVVVTGREFEVLGASEVHVYDARKARQAAEAKEQEKKEQEEKEEARVAAEAATAGAESTGASASGASATAKAAILATCVLKPGMRYSLDKGILTSP